MLQQFFCDSLATFSSNFSLGLITTHYLAHWFGNACMFYVSTRTWYKWQGSNTSRSNLSCMRPKYGLWTYEFIIYELKAMLELLFRNIADVHPPYMASRIEVSPSHRWFKTLNKINNWRPRTSTKRKWGCNRSTGKYRFDPTARSGGRS